jgi:CO/xanthine dehydrogenase Mo-binding subunit
LTISLGDIKDGFKQADVIIENTYYTGRAEPAPLETEGAVAQIEIDGSIVVYSSTQAPNKDRIQIARALGISENQVRVITPFIGGGFGSKIEAHVQIHAALLAQATGKPVKIIRSREEAIRSHVKRHPFYLECRTGARRDGTITAVEVKAYADTGPYINLGPEVVGVAVMNSSGPYYTPNALLEGFTVMTNNPIGGAMRGFGGPQAAFAYETQMDLLAETLKMDPLEIRLKNGLGTGMQVPTGAKIRQGDGMRACLEEAARLIEWDKRKEKESKPAAHLRRGWGLAAHVFTLAYGRKIPDNAGVVLELAGDGTLSLRTGAADIGQGLHTALAQLASESLGIEVSQVRVISPDTEKTLDSGATNASRSVIISGQAAVQAAREIKKTLLITASEETGLPIEVLNLKNGWLTAEGERINMSVKDLANKSRRLNRSISAIGYYAVEYPEPLPPNSYPHAPNIYTFGAQAAQVLVDIETGQVMIEKLVAVHDAGLIVNPFGALGQIEGGAAMGIGYALMEEIHSEKGQILTDSLDTYLLPTAKDIPPMEVKILEFPEPYTPFGVKGIGEVGILPTAPAITNAIHDATGISINCIPMTAERVLKSLAALKDDQIN